MVVNGRTYAHLPGDRPDAHLHQPGRSPADGHAGRPGTVSRPAGRAASSRAASPTTPAGGSSARPREPARCAHLTLTYDAAGIPGDVTDPLGAGVWRSPTTPPGAFDRSRPCPVRAPSRYAYDANGNASTLTPPGRPGHAFGYTAVDLTRATFRPTLRRAPPRPATPTTPTASHARRPPGRAAGGSGLRHRRPARPPRPCRAGVRGYAYDAASRLPASPLPAAWLWPTPTTAGCSPARRSAGPWRAASAAPTTTTSASPPSASTGQPRHLPVRPRRPADGRRRPDPDPHPQNGLLTGTTLGASPTPGATTASASRPPTRPRRAAPSSSAPLTRATRSGASRRTTETLERRDRHLRLHLRPGRAPHRSPEERRGRRRLHLRRQRQPPERRPAPAAR